jgi:AcrR family transcriptional regulator
MARSAQRSRRPLNRERVLAAAVALADGQGLDALSMRRLAKELGVEAMSLYNHVANKDAILSGILDTVLHEIELPEDEDWKSALRRHAISAHDAFARHRWACALSVSPAVERVLDVQIRQMEWKLRRLRTGGFSDELTYHALHVLDSHVTGFTLWEQSHNVSSDTIGDIAAAFLARFPRAEYPHAYEHVEQHVTGFGRDLSAFELGLDLLLDGLERLRDAG